MPAESERQRRFMGAELGRLRSGEATETGMSESQLEDFASSEGLYEQKMKTKKAPKVVTSSNTDHTLVKAMRAITNFIGIIEKAAPRSSGKPTGGQSASSAYRRNQENWQRSGSPKSKPSRRRGGPQADRDLSREVLKEAKRLLKDNRYISISPAEIAETLGINKRTVGIYLKQHKLSDAARANERNTKILRQVSIQRPYAQIAEEMGLRVAQIKKLVQRTKRKAQERQDRYDAEQAAQAETPQVEPKVVEDSPSVEPGEERPPSYDVFREQQGLQPLRNTRKIEETPVENTNEGNFSNVQSAYQEKQLNKAARGDYPGSTWEMPFSDKWTEEGIDKKLQEYKERRATENLATAQSGSKSQGTLPPALRNQMREPIPENIQPSSERLLDTFEGAYQEKQLMEQQEEEGLPPIHGRGIPPTHAGQGRPPTPSAEGVIPSGAKINFDRRGSTRPKGLTQSNKRAGRTKIKRHTHMTPQSERLTAKELLPSMDSQGNFISNKSIPFTPDKQEVLATAFNAIDSFIKQQENAYPPTKGQRRENKRRKARRMGVSGRGVKDTQQIIGRKGRKGSG